MLNSPANGGYSGFFMNNSTTGYATGNKIVKTTNAGNSWMLQYSQQSSTLLSIFFVDLNIGYIAGGSGNVLKTTNGGSLWALQQNLATSNVLRDIQFLNANTGYAVGDNGTIIKTTNGGGDPIGVTPISNEVPNDFSLGQNYPNPFNPATNIEFQIPQSNYVKISVFDILGRELAILVNEKLKPGTYEIEWNASNYPSGIYLYRLTADDFAETKKMILAK